MTNSTIKWTIEYPKGDALEWSEQDFDTGEWDRVSKIFYDQTVTTKANKTAVINKEKVKSLGVSRQFFEF